MDDFTFADLGYTKSEHAPNTLRAYRSDVAQLAGWCQAAGRSPADPGTVVAYLHHLDASGARRSTIARVLSSLAHHARATGQADPTRHPDVADAWKALRHNGLDDTDHATPLLPPLLFDVVAACPTHKTWARRAPEPSLGGARDRALLLVGFVGGLRRSEIVALHVEDLLPDPDGIRLHIDDADPLLPRGQHPSRCPVRALERWLALSDITTGPVFRGVTKANRPGPRALNAESVNALVQQAIARAGHDPAGYSAHSLRAGLVTWSQAHGVPDDVIAAHTRHRSVPGVRAYARRGDAAPPDVEAARSASA